MRIPAAYSIVPYYHSWLNSVIWSISKNLVEKDMQLIFLSRFLVIFGFIKSFISLEKSYLLRYWRQNHIKKNDKYMPHVPTFAIEAAIYRACNFQKQSFADLLENRCSDLLEHKCSPVKFVKFLRTLFLQDTFSSCFWTWLKKNGTVVLQCVLRKFS